ncbi:MAG: dihydroorotate dehydrogenase electron transfer subunit [Synergistaceae bacterium]|nr:dihydroorotate dehydrogenase electron transfer subunit [Synergistaceae bacterium]
MSLILSNERVGKDFYLMKAVKPERTGAARMGQFYMLRAWGSCPVLSRPLSVFDERGETVSFLYKVVGRGTEIFSTLQKGDGITMLGPLGNSFPKERGSIALVGGGAGIAPLYLAAKQLRQSKTTVDIYLGFSEESFLTEEYKLVADSLVVNVGGFITDEIDPSRYEHVMTCGPEPMMRALYEKCAGKNLRASLESRMACGVGACLVCNCKTAGGNKKVCKDGPVFKGAEVFGI